MKEERVLKVKLMNSQGKILDALLLLPSEQKEQEVLFSLLVEDIEVKTSQTE